MSVTEEDNTRQKYYLVRRIAELCNEINDIFNAVVSMQVAHKYLL